MSVQRQLRREISKIVASAEYRFQKVLDGEPFEKEEFGNGSATEDWSADQYVKPEPEAQGLAKEAMTGQNGSPNGRAETSEVGVKSEGVQDPHCDVAMSDAK